eukprot:gene19379-26452_t
MKKIAIGAVFAAMVAAGTYVYAQSDNMAGMDHSKMAGMGSGDMSGMAGMGGMGGGMQTHPA